MIITKNQLSSAITLTHALFGYHLIVSGVRDYSDFGENKELSALNVDFTMITFKQKPNKFPVW